VIRKADLNLCIVLAGALLLGSLWGERFISVDAANSASKATRSRSQPPQGSAAPSAASSYDVPISGSVLDSIGRRLTISGTVHLELAEPSPVPVPPPVGITFGGIVDSFGTPVTQATAGKVLFLKGAGFPMTSDVPPVSPSSLRLSIADHSLIVSAWTHTSVMFSIPNTFSDTLTAPVTGKFSVWRQQAGQWQLLGSGGTLTILPSPRVGAPRR